MIRPGNSSLVAEIIDFRKFSQLPRFAHLLQRIEYLGSRADITESKQLSALRRKNQAGGHQAGFQLFPSAGSLPMLAMTYRVCFA